MQKTTRNILPEEDEMIYRDYILGIRIVKVPLSESDNYGYQFEAPEHTEISFEDPELAELYADIYFDVNGFEEAGTGDRGVPPEIIQAGRDTLAAYLLTQPYTDINWVASFYGKKTMKIERYVANVRNRAQEIREGAKDSTKYNHDSILYWFRSLITLPLVIITKYWHSNLSATRINQDGT